MCRQKIASNLGSISSWAYCLVDECLFSMSEPSCVYRSGLSPARSPHIHLPSIDTSSGIYRNLRLRVLACIVSLIAWSLLFSLASCSATEQKATRQSPPLQVGIVVYFCLRAEVAVIESSRHRQPCSLQQHFRLLSPAALILHKINVEDLKVASHHCDLRMSYVGGKTEHWLRSAYVYLLKK